MANEPLCPRQTLPEEGAGESENSGDLALCRSHKFLVSYQPTVNSHIECLGTPLATHHLLMYVGFYHRDDSLVLLVRTSSLN